MTLPSFGKTRANPNWTAVVPQNIHARHTFASAKPNSI
jgi:hypothetical protein